MGTSMVEALGVRLVDPEKVTAARVAMPRKSAVTDLAQVFALLGEPGRLRLLASLLEAGEMCVGDLAATTGMSESAVSHALRLLRAHRVVAVSRRGRMAYYRLADAHVQLLLDVGLTHAQHSAISG
jgi:ArsR family transcriptional regulator, lead/cadmium/zinc/bismuth-responsive transcriptional repressor